MTQQHTPLRSGMTAIAAVLALSSTAAFAQTADQAVAEPAAPVIAAPPPPAAAAAPITIAPIDAATATPMAAPDAAPAAMAPVAPAAAPMATRSTPVIHTPEAAAAERASRAPQRSASGTRTTVSRSTVTTRSTTPPVAVAPKATPAPAPEAAPAPVLEPATPPAPATTATTRTTTQTANSDTLPIAAGAIGLGLIALGAGAYLFARRRREDDEDAIAEPTAGTIVTPVMSPVYAVAPEAVTAVPGTPIMAREEIGDEQMTLANGFDLSHFGRHARAAYRGPTPDNPSHSLKRRLARASFFDQREREAIANGTAPAEPRPLAARTAPSVAAQNEDQIVVRPGYRRPSRFFGTAFQR